MENGTYKYNPWGQKLNNQNCLHSQEYSPTHSYTPTLDIRKKVFLSKRTTGHCLVEGHWSAPAMPTLLKYSLHDQVWPSEFNSLGTTWWQRELTPACCPQTCKYVSWCNLYPPNKCVKQFLKNKYGLSCLGKVICTHFHDAHT